MKTTGIIAAFIAVAAAVPVQKRDIVWVVETSEVVETVYQTTTVWVDSLPESTAAASATTPAGGEFYNDQYGHRSSQAAASVVAVPSTSSSSSASTSSSVFVPAPAPSTLATSTSSSVAPVVPAYTPPAVSTEAAPTTTTPAPVVVPTTSAYIVPAPVTIAAAPAPTQSTGGSSAPSGSTHTGDITWYDTGMGSCGETSNNGDSIVALPHVLMNNPANPNSNPLCGKTITISGPGGEYTATIVDTCMGCDGDAIDVDHKLFDKVTNTGDGRVHGINWWFN